MKRKITALIVVVAVLATMFALLIPASATNFSDSVFFDVEFNQGSYNELTGWFEGTVTENGLAPGSLEFIQDDELGKTVGHFQDYSIGYQGIDYDMLDGEFTAEVYVKVALQQRYTMIFGDLYTYPYPTYKLVGGWGIMAQNYTNGVVEYNEDQTIKVNTNHGYDRGISAVEGLGPTTTTYNWPDRYSYGSWQHIVYVHTDGAGYFYANGELVSTQDSPAKLGGPNGTYADYGLRIGGYDYTDNWNAADMCISYARLYYQAATAADVADMYANRNADFGAHDYVPPTPSPSPSPRPEYFNLDEHVLFHADYTTGSYEDISGNYTLDDIDAELEEDPTGADRLVAFFDEYSYADYSGPDLKNYDLGDGITLEAMVYLNDAAYGKQNGVLCLRDGSITLQDYNHTELKEDDIVIGYEDLAGFRCHDVIDGTGTMGNAYTTDAAFPIGEWIHVVGVSDGVTNKYYLNGELAATYVRNDKPLPSVSSGQTRLQVGAVGNETFDGYIAYARVFSCDAKDWQVAELYEDAISEKISDGLHVAQDGKTYLYENNAIKTSFTGLYKHTDGKNYYLINGCWQENFTGIYKGKTYTMYIKKGIFDTTFTGLAKNSEGQSLYFVNGYQKTSFTGVYKGNTYTMYIKKGVFDNTFTGIAQNADGQSLYFVNGYQKTSFTGLYKNAQGQSVYIKKGVWDTSFTGVYKGNTYTMYIKKGVFDNTFTGLAKNADGQSLYFVNGYQKTSFTGVYKGNTYTMYIKKGVFDNTFTGVAKNADNQLLYFVKGYWKSSYSGTVTVGGVKYKVTKGICTKV